MRPWNIATLATIAVAPSFAFASEGSSAARKRILVYTVSAGYEHEVVHREAPDRPSLVERAIVELARASGRMEATLSRSASDFTRERLATFDLVFFYTTGELPFSDEQRGALFEFVKSGKGFAGAHCASDTFYAVPEYGAMLGAYFDGHPWHEKVRIRVEDRAHAATAHLGDSFEIADEIYQFKAPYDRSRLHVLLSLDPRHVDLTREGVHRTDGDFAVAWCRTYGAGRVFYTALGHRPEVWADERFVQHLRGGLEWALRLEPIPPPNAEAARKPPTESPRKSDAEPPRKSDDARGSHAEESSRSAALRRSCPQG